MHGYLSLYSLRYIKALVYLARECSGSPAKFLRSYWQTDNFSHLPAGKVGRIDPLYQLVALGISLQILVGLAMITADVAGKFTGGGAFGAATIIAYPLLWAILVLFGLVVMRLPGFPKRIGKLIVCAVLERQVKQLRAKNDIVVVAVAGSVGKTSTKIAIAKLLAEEKRVIYQIGNYNDPTTVPLVFFDHAQPSLLNVIAWVKVFLQNNRQLRRPYPYDVVVTELGTDEPGVMKKFAYVHPDLTVLTAVTDEHMERFKTLESVAAEELTVFDYSKQVLVNVDDVPAKFLASRSYEAYSLKKGDYRTVSRQDAGLDGQKLKLDLKGMKLEVTVKLLGSQGAKSAVAAAAVAAKLGLQTDSIVQGLAKLEAFSGRMKLLPGARSSLIIDDTYNASPAAVKAALDVLYVTQSPHKIAILGSMNELGETSQQSHTAIGAYCDPKQLDEVVTIGTEAEQWLAPAAAQAGCKVSSFSSPYAAGEYVAQQLRKGAIILAKGSQNGVFAEEAVKILLKTPEDSHKLVRQSAYWLGVKRKQFHDAV